MYIYIYIYTYICVYSWLVVIATPLTKMSHSVGMMTVPTKWKNKTCSKPPTSIVYLANQ